MSEPKSITCSTKTIKIFRWARKHIWSNFDEKGLNFEKFSIDSSQETGIEKIQHSGSILNDKINATFVNNFNLFFIKIDENLIKNTENVNKNNGVLSLIDKALSTDNSL